MARPRRIDWPACAANLAALIPRDRLHPAVVSWTANAAHRRRMWGLAVSGGADSLALLLLVWAHWPEQRRRLRVLHFDHALRRAAAEDARFCRRVARALGVEFAMEKWKRPRGSVRPSEAAARIARLGFVHARAQVIWFAHHQDDVAETLLMRLARGSGAAGLSAPRPVQTHRDEWIHLRPLLALQKRELVQALRKAGARWREDRTNGRPDYFRNRVRQAVLPAWVAAAERDAVAGAARTRDLLAEDDEALEQWVDRASLFGRDGSLLLSRAKTLPRAVVRRALHRWLLCAPRPLDISRQAFESLLLAAERGRDTRHSLGAALFAQIRAGRLRFVPGIDGPKIHRRVN